MDIWQCNLRHLRAALEVCHLGSINAAAQAVNLTQPAITQALAKLESQLGIMLFERSPIGMSPTPAALLLAPRIAAVLDYIASPRVTMSQLRAFITLSGEGSYAAAAERSGIAQPSLHRAVSDLSLALGQPLLERRGRGLTLTVQGRKIARSFRLAYAELEAGLADIEALKGHETGKIAIGAMPLSRARLLPDAVATFHKIYPEVEIKISEGSHAELIEPLRDGALDLMIGALRDGGIGDDVIQKPLFKDRPVVIARAGHPLSAAKLSIDGAADLETLSQYPWIIAAPGTPLRVQWERMFTQARLPAPPVPIECGSVITIRQILIKSDFLTLLSPDQVAVELEAGWLTQICAAPDDFIRTIGMTTRTGWTPTGLQKAFLKTLENLGESEIEQIL
jgi:LysR family transcriptional regulator, regulator for genes of the gallate degradation pathway